MSVEVLSLGPTLGGDAIQRIRHVGADIVVPVLVQAQGARGVLHEEVEQADLVVLDLGHGLRDVVCDEVGAARLGRQRELLLRPRHGGCRYWRDWRGRGVGRACRGWEDEGVGEPDEVVEQSGEEAYEEDGQEQEAQEIIVAGRCFGG